MGFTINADDPRTIRAVELAAEARFWLSGCNPAGEDVYGVPSQSEAGRYYIVTRATCDCPDFQNQDASAGPRLCKHLLAVRLYTELVRAQNQQPSSRRRGHLTIVP